MAILAKTYSRPVIDLTSPAGNVFSLIGEVRNLGRQLSMTTAEVKAIQADMMSSDYEHAITVFDNNFGDFVDLVR